MSVLPICRALAQQNPPEKPEPLKTSITVVGGVAAETPANITVLGPLQLQETPGVNLDDRLREVPGFSLFRRTSSVVAHPTTQGISLRGIGSSGASRTLVLWDGVPVNDPFGGWVYWTQLPPEEIERVEILRGAATSVFGDKAMTGAIALFSRTPARRRLGASYEGGNRDTHDVSADFTNVFSRWAFSGWGRAFTTGGYYLVPGNIRGPVDTLAGVRFATGGARLDFANMLFFKFDLLAEDRKNGTPLQTNSTGMGMASLRFERAFGSNSLSLAGFHTREQFHAGFSAIAGDRKTERLTMRQTVPAEAEGGDALWQHASSSWNLLGGADVYRVEGVSTDHLAPTGIREGGGSQLQHGVFAQADKTFGALRLFLGGRHSFTGAGRNFFSPSAGFVAGRRRLRARGSVYRGFRSPTLNELYREFRAGNSVTQANAALRPETLFGAEAGLDIVGESAGGRLTFYRNSLDDVITNVTLSSSASQIIRQRRNAASALSRGAEAEAHARWRQWRLELGYLFADSRYANGKRVAQVPRHQGSGQFIFQQGGTLASFGVRSYAAQFDDDLNQFLLPGFATLQFVARQKIRAGLSAVAEFENLLDRRFFTGFSPTPAIGAPRLWRAGIRWQGHL